MFSFILAFPIIWLLYKFGIVRQLDVDFSVLVESRKDKVGVPIMGGLVIIIPIVILNLLYAPVGSTKLAVLVVVISAFLGAIDDVLNIYGKKRRVRPIYRTLKLMKVHKNVWMRIYFTLLLPWTIFKRVFFVLGSNPGKGLFPHEKILVQFLAGSIVAFWVFFRVNWASPADLWIPFIGVINIGIFMIPFIIFTVISMTNAVNIADGMDGLSAGILLPAFISMTIIAISQELPTALTLLDIPNTLFAGSVVGGLIAYLYFNVPPARVQMGDVGSLSLGALLAVIAFTLRIPLLLPIIGFIFVAEVGSTLLQSMYRKLFGRRLFKMAPLHHHFELLGWKEEKVVMRFWIGAIIFAIFGLWIYFNGYFPYY